MVEREPDKPLAYLLFMGAYGICMVVVGVQGYRHDGRWQSLLIIVGSVIVIAAVVQKLYKKIRHDRLRRRRVVSDGAVR